MSHQNPTVDLTTSVAGVALPSCLLNASGPVCATLEELKQLGEAETGGIVTKSCTLLARDGNEEPRGAFLPFGSIQSMGLPNLGYKAYINFIPQLKELFPRKPVIVSVAGLCVDDNLKMVSEIYAAKPDLLELNLSCPNLEGKPQMAYDFEATDKLLSQLPIDANVPLGLKLPPYFDPSHVDTMAEIIKKHEVVRFVTLINSVGNCLVIDPSTDTCAIRPKGGFGGLSGQYIKPIGLANVRGFRDRLQDRVDIIGVGGIMNGTDAFQYLLAGANAVQVGTCLWMEGTSCFQRLQTELSAVLVYKNYSSVKECVGKLKRLPPLQSTSRPASGKKLPDAGTTSEDPGHECNNETSEENVICNDTVRPSGSGQTTSVSGF